jgi:hypothetical protein
MRLRENEQIYIVYDVPDVIHALEVRETLAKLSVVGRRIICNPRRSVEDFSEGFSHLFRETGIDPIVANTARFG